MGLLWLIPAFPVLSILAVTHWKLNGDRIPRPVLDSTPNDEIFAIVSRRASEERKSRRGEWERVVDENSTCRRTEESEEKQKTKTCDATSKNDVKRNFNSIPILSCWLPKIATIYDSLPGIQARERYPDEIDGEMFAIYRNNDDVNDIDVDSVEDDFFDAIQTRSLDEWDYNRLGNYWRVKGANHKAVDCFRQGLHLNPNQPDLLLNLARILLHLNYLADSRALVERCLTLTSSSSEEEEEEEENNSWLEHFTLGEINELVGSFEEALGHYKMTLTLNPSFELAEWHVMNLEEQLAREADTEMVIQHTGVIVLLLTIAVFLGLVYILDGDEDKEKICDKDLLASSRKITRKNKASKFK